MDNKNAKAEFIKKAMKYGYSEKSAKSLAKTGDRVINKAAYYANLSAMLIRLD